ncbi:uncharacterized protein LOC111000180 [Pieris rapae]|uniref:uncharacterized protein LOC111000180 n=1 Tax=Pieris rapae TaxID=64459 RepID=UPI001E27B7CB|nr:uncharacterized protein LOC111000180 [Pieris rapae]
MAYNRNQRFASSPPYFRILDPGAYQNTGTALVKINKAPFLSKKERQLQSGNKIWTHAIYNNNSTPFIPNCSAFMSNIPRFPYEAVNTFSDFEDILCECEDPNVCECESDNKSTPTVICQGKVRRILYKGPPPKSNQSGGLSAPSKKDKGFEINPDGSHKRVFIKPEKECPPFYNTAINESTAFYRGCKWSRRTGKIPIAKNNFPGPAHYSIVHEPNIAEICAEKVRSFKRKTSKQFRFIEMVQRRNTLDNLPGPSSYSPENIKGTQLNYLGPKAARFTGSISNKWPGPADHWLQRDFDLPTRPSKLCKAILPQRAPFLSHATRLKTPKIVDLSPASYVPIYKPCQFIRCSKAPFSVSTKRFKEIIYNDEDDHDYFDEFENSPREDKDITITKHPTWQFKSKTVRMKPLKKEALRSISIHPQPSSIKKRPLELQHGSPFFSSEARFRPWFNWIAVHAKVKTPGPSYYTPEKARCYPAVAHGPLTRVERFLPFHKESPAPNEYKVSNGIETILHTHNERLKSNIINQHKFHWIAPGVSRLLNNEEKELILLNRSIELLNPDDVIDSFGSKLKRGKKEKKVLRCLNKN